MQFFSQKICIFEILDIFTAEEKQNDQFISGTVMVVAQRKNSLC
jgi:hypothetical protein